MLETVKSVLDHERDRLVPPCDVNGTVTGKASWGWENVVLQFVSVLVWPKLIAEILHCCLVKKSETLLGGSTVKMTIRQ